MKAFYYVALVLVIVGAVNWGLVGLFQFDLVAALFSESGSRASAPVARVVYALVDLAGLAVALAAWPLRNQFVALGRSTRA